MLQRIRPLQGGWTALHVAAFFNRADVVGALLDDARLDVARSTGVRGACFFRFADFVTVESTCRCASSIACWLATIRQFRSSCYFTLRSLSPLRTAAQPFNLPSGTAMALPLPC